MLPLPPVTEVYVVWHPDDHAGAVVAREILAHFHGDPFTNLIGEAVQAYPRSAGWTGPDDAPRPIPFPGRPPADGVPEAEFIAVVPVLGTELAAAVESGKGTWHDYAVDIATGHERHPHRVQVFPLVLARSSLDGTRISRILGRFQSIGPEPADPADPAALPDLTRCCRDLAQGIAQLAGGTSGDRLRVFISHTRGDREPARDRSSDLVSMVRWAMNQTRLKDFFDARDVQPGYDWSEAVYRTAATSALLAVRTDQYAHNTWCQREMLTAKCAGMPVVILDALQHTDERGSFLLEHVPRVPVRATGANWQPEDIDRGLNLLVTECLTQALWQHQRRLAASRWELEIGWWAPRAPEPATLVEWLTTERAAGRLPPDRPVRILHPDPPLGPAERQVLASLAALAGIPGPLEIVTPRSLAAQVAGAAT